jgi:hypothetical protein
MKADNVLQEVVLLTGKELAARAAVEGRHRTARVDGRRLLAVETHAVVRIRPPRSDLSPFNVLLLNLRPAKPFECSLVTRLQYSTRSPGMAANDSRFSVLHSNQPARWQGWQKVLVPAENLVPTGFPDGWKGIEAIVLDFHSREGRGTVILGDVELMQVRRPRGPRMSDEELLDSLDLDRPELRAVARHARRGDIQKAVSAYAAHLRRAKLPPTGDVRPHKHYAPAAADDICRHVILEQQLPTKINWQCNPIGYLEWMHAFNRHTWMGTLCAAFHASPGTKRRRYARKLDYFMRTWMAQNPEPVGHNGGLDPAWETLSTSCRINWSWPHVLGVAQQSDGMSDRTLVDMAKMIHAHAEHLLAYWGHCNWFVSESAAILTAAALLPEFRRAEHWMNASMRRLEREMRAQVFRDGVQYELSPGYHTMCADLFYLARVRAGFRDRQFSEAYRRRLVRMFDYLAGITRPDGTHPVMNDAGTCLPRGNRRLREVGRAEKRRDWIWAGSGGKEGRPPEVGSVHFPDAGYAVMRSGWDHMDCWALIDMGQFGAAHQHEDKLQVELYARGTPFLVDPGISSYQDDPVVRFFRRGDAHNTIRIDGLGQWRARGRDRKRYCSSSRGLNLWATGRGLDVAMGRYDEPYGMSRTGIHARGDKAAADRLVEGITHTRALLFVRPDYWLILDSVAGPGTHNVEALWHFAPMHVRTDEATTTVRTNRLTHANLELICRADWKGATLGLVTGSEEPVQGFIAVDNEVKPAPCAIVARRKRLPLNGVTVAVPYSGGSDSGFRVRTRSVRGKAAAGTLIIVARPGGVTDRFLWRHTGRGVLEADGIRANGLLAAVRTDGNGQLEYAALADGRSLRVGGLSLEGKPAKLAER